VCQVSAECAWCPGTFHFDTRPDCDREFESMGRIFVARHGESEANVRRVFDNRNRGLPLTGRGREQSAAMASEVATYAPTWVYSSPVLRARQTAEYVARASSASIVEAAALAEFNVGILEGRDDEAAHEMYAELRRRWAADDWEARLPGGESLREAHDRLINFLESLRRRHSREVVAVVSHGGLYSTVLPRLCPLKDCGAGHSDFGYAAVGVLVDDGDRMLYELRGTPPTHRLWPRP
jgi:broad specificity phosphatase PhoE